MKLHREKKLAPPSDAPEVMLMICFADSESKLVLLPADAGTFFILTEILQGETIDFSVFDKTHTLNNEPEMFPELKLKYSSPH